MRQVRDLRSYDPTRSYDWNYANAPDPIEMDIPEVPGSWTFCGIPVGSPLGIPAGPLLNGKWCLYYASLGYDVVTYKTVRSSEYPCYPLPNLQPVDCNQISGSENELPVSSEMRGSWAVSYGMPSQPPEVWRDDIAATRAALPVSTLLSVSVVATVQEKWSLDDIAADYAQCARWAVDAGADIVETNFSCPNVSTCDGQLYQHTDDASRVAQQVRESIGDKPYVVKIGHVQSREQASELLLALAPFVDALAMTNSVAVRVRGNDGLLFAGERRGICGAAIVDASIDQTRLFHDLVQEQHSATQLIGVGGISCCDDVHRYLDAGAHACHIASAAMVNPDVGIGIRLELSKSSEQPGSTC